MNKLIILILIVVSQIVYAQEIDKDSLKTEEVNIVKPYTPKIKDAFKIKKNPVLGDDEIKEKKEVSYTIHSVPVASTFTPSKGKAKGVVQKNKERVSENFIKVGFGNYMTPLVEAFAHRSTTNENDFGTNFLFHSSNGDLPEVALDNNFINSKVSAYYNKKTDFFDWETGVVYHYQKQNWYGIHASTLLTDTELNAIDSKQIYNSFAVNGAIKYYDSNFKGVKLNMNLLTDAYKSSEFHVKLNPQFEFPLFDDWLNTDFRLEYIGGSFKKDYANNNSIEYGFYNIGFSPNYKYTQDFLSFTIGAKIVYSATVKETGTSQFFFYPDINASYELIQDVLSIYTGVTGDIHQHSYQSFIAKNEFVSPTLNIERTNEQYNAKLGTKGKLAANVTFNLNASYKYENSKPLFKLNKVIAVADNYQYGNSFGVIYDNVTTLGFFGELGVDLSKEVRFGANATFNSYSLEYQKSAWNLPNLEAAIFANYDANKIIVGANLFFVGDRKDEYLNNSLFTNPQEITNKAYMDLNINLGYRFSNKLNALINGNNLLGNNYQPFTNYKAQGIQVLGGLKYKFDL